MSDRLPAEPDEIRRAAAAFYLKGRTLEEALAAWRADYDAPTFRQRRPLIARLGTVIRRLAREAEAQDSAAVDPMRQRVRPRGASRR